MIEKGSPSGETSARSSPAVAARATRPGRNEARAGAATHARHALGDEGAVLALKEHHVGERAQGGDVDVVEPEVGHPSAAAQLADQLEGNARTRKLTGGAAWVELGVCHGDALGNEVCRLVVVGDHDVDSTPQKPSDLVGGGDSVVNGDEKAWGALARDALERLAREAVALPKAPGDEGVNVAPQAAKGKGQKAGRRHAVDVEVAKDGDGLALVQGAAHPVRNLPHAGDAEGVGPVSIQGGREKLASLVDVVVTARGENPRDHRGNTQGSGELAGPVLVALENRPAAALPHAGHLEHLDAERGYGGAADERRRHRSLLACHVVSLGCAGPGARAVYHF